MSIQHLMSRAFVEESQPEPIVDNISTENFKNIHKISYKEDLATEGFLDSILDIFRSQSSRIKNKINNINPKDEAKVIMDLKEFKSYSEAFIKLVSNSNITLEDIENISKGLTTNKLKVDKDNLDYRIFTDIEDYEYFQAVDKGIGNKDIEIDRLSDHTKQLNLYKIPALGFFDGLMNEVYFNLYEIEINNDLDKVLKTKSFFYMSEFESKENNSDGFKTLNKKDIEEYVKYLKSLNLDNIKINIKTDKDNILGKNKLTFNGNLSRYAFENYFKKLIEGYFNLLNYTIRRLEQGITTESFSAENYQSELALEGIWSNFINKYKSEDTLIKNKIKDINLKKSCKAIISYESLIAYDKFIKELLNTDFDLEKFKKLRDKSSANTLKLNTNEDVPNIGVFELYTRRPYLGYDALTFIGNSPEFWKMIKGSEQENIDNIKDLVSHYSYYCVPCFNLLSVNNKKLKLTKQGVEMSIVNLDKRDIKIYFKNSNFDGKIHVFENIVNMEDYLEIENINIEEDEIKKIYEFIKNFNINHYKMPENIKGDKILGNLFTVVDFQNSGDYVKKSLDDLVNKFYKRVLDNYYGIIKALLKNIDNNTDTNKFIKEGYNVGDFTTESYNTLVNELQNYNINYDKDKLAFGEDRLDYANELSMECYKFKLDKEVNNWDELATEGIGESLKKAGKFIIDKIKQFIEWIKKVFFNKKEKINKDIKIIESKDKENKVIEVRAEKITKKLENKIGSINDAIDKHIKDIKADREKYEAEAKRDRERIKGLKIDVNELEVASKDLEELLARETIKLTNTLDEGILMINKSLANFYGLKARLLSILLNKDAKYIFVNDEIKKDTIAVHIIELLDKIDEKTISSVKLPEFTPSEGEYKTLSDKLQLYKSGNLLKYAKLEFNMLDAHKGEITNFLNKLKEDDPLIKEAKTIISSFTTASKELENVVRNYLDLCNEFDKARDLLRTYKFSIEDERKIFDATMTHEVSW